MMKMKVTLIAMAAATTAAALYGRPDGKPQDRPDPEVLTQEMMVEFDANEDALLSAEEFAYALEQHHLRHEALHANHPNRDQDVERKEPNFPKVASYLVMRCDQDGDKNLNIDELLDVMSKLHRYRGKGRPATQEEES